ncbi:LytR/AlgR family response regulator transcription factor [Sporosarcina siberiensis]|uniref:LytR/AlgR family response regulator transcription factor n=1 Tax=Sporosarcina siberiensis TaxID=1365606 RepID=A0ABW4SHM1_9BACL
MKHILIIEDDEQIQNFLHSILVDMNQNFYIHISPSAGQALKISNTYDISLFIIDIQLTDYKGTDLANELRDLQKYKYTPMIFATAIATEELRAYREIKCYDYLVKPFTKEEVKTSVLNVLDYLHTIKIDVPTVRIEQKGFIFEYQLQDIVYIESFGKKMVIHMKNPDGDLIQEDIAGYSLKSILDLLKNGPFQQCHKSYIINTDFIERIVKAKSTLSLRGTSISLPIGNKYRDVIMGTD